jgi:peptidyl-prolyl cis-trans isomerase C
VPAVETGAARRALAWLVRQPLVHFAVLGAAIFGAYELTRGGREPTAAEIRMDAGQVRWLADTWATQFGRPPTAAELRTAIARQADEEMRYREALALGLERDDTIVRRRLAQKYDFLLGDRARAPRAGELESYFAGHRQRYVDVQRVSFCQAWFGGEPGGEGLDRAHSVLARLTPAQRRSEETPLGAEGLPAPPCAEGSDLQHVAREFGPTFSAALPRLPRGEWAGPVQSGYGYHLVRVTAVAAGRPLEFAAARERVEADWREATAETDRRRDDAALRARYRVTVDDAAVARFSAVR